MEGVNTMKVVALVAVVAIWIAWKFRDKSIIHIPLLNLSYVVLLGLFLEHFGNPAAAQSLKVQSLEAQALGTTNSTNLNVMTYFHVGTSIIFFIGIPIQMAIIGISHRIYRSKAALCMCPRMERVSVLSITASVVAFVMFV